MSRNHSQENLFKHVEIENCDNSSAVFDDARPLEHSDCYRYAGAPDRQNDVLNGTASHCAPFRAERNAAPTAGARRCGASLTSASSLGAAFRYFPEAAHLRQWSFE